MRAQTIIKRVLGALGPHLVPPPRPTAYMGDYTVMTRTVAGHTMLLDTRDRTLTPCILMHGHWERGVCAFLSERIRPRMTVVEIGANVGYHSILIGTAIQSLGKLYAFEPNARVAHLLRANLDTNGVLGRAVVVPSAVADHDGTVTFYALRAHHGSSSLLAFDSAFLDRIGDRSDEVTVPCTTLDTFLAAHSASVDLIKIDAEGAEPLIFDGMLETLTRNPHVQIILEFNPSFFSRAQRDPRGFLEARVAEGFVLRSLDREGRPMSATVEGLLRDPDEESLWGHAHELYLSRTI